MNNEEKIIMLLEQILDKLCDIERSCDNCDAELACIACDTARIGDE